MSAPTLDPTVGPGLDLDARLRQIGDRLDEIAAAQQAERRERERWTELVHELTPVAQAAMTLASDELEELNRDVSVDDVTRFARTLVRSLPQLEAMLVQLASAGELVHEVTSLTGAGMGALSDALGTAEQRGYFAAARSGGAVLDRMARTLSGGAPEQAPSALALARRLRDPEVRRGLALALDLLRALGAVEATPNPATTPHPAKD